MHRPAEKSVGTEVVVAGRGHGRRGWPCSCRYALTMLEQIASCEVANRPGRLEPRVLKRRRHGYKRMLKPRSQLRRDLHKHCT